MEHAEIRQRRDGRHAVVSELGAFEIEPLQLGELRDEFERVVICAALIGQANRDDRRRIGRFDDAALFADLFDGFDLFLRQADGFLGLRRRCFPGSVG
jgi:hypothetical protein